MLAVLAGCRPGTVAVSFRPDAGATYRYDVDVKSVSTTTLEGHRPDRKTEQVRLVAEHTVLDAGPHGVRLRILVGEPGSVAQIFVVRFNRAAQLESIESTEGASTEVAGVLGVPEIFPAAAGAPPGRRLAPGDTWSSTREVSVPGADRPSRLRVRGRLVELGRVGDEDVARIRTTADLPLRATSDSLDLDGHQRITQRATYDIDDGAVRSAHATTVGRFTVKVRPPAGTSAAPVPGTLEVRLTSTTRRLPPAS